MSLLLLVPAAVAFLSVILCPAIGAYLLLAVGPLIIGIPRPENGMPLRPNEALLLLVIAALCVRTLLLMLSRRRRPLPLDRLDRALLVLTIASSIAPLMWRAVRGLPLSQDDLLYALVMPKYYLLFRLFRITIVTHLDVATCLRVSMASSMVVAMIAMLQVLNLLGVPEFLQSYYNDPFNDVLDFTDRGTSTLGIAFGVGNVMIMNLIIALALHRAARGRRWPLLGAAAIYLSGCIAAGEISEYIGFAVALVTFGLLTHSMRRSLSLVTVGAVVALPFWPVVERRLMSLDGQIGTTSSWEARWWNLTHVVLPQLLSGSNWLLGVGPAARVDAPAGYVWGRFVYIESGYLWLLWVGGVPLVLAFGYFAGLALRELRRVADKADDSPVGIAATASFCFLTAMIVMMLFDPHLTIRGSADLFFPLLAISLVQLPVMKQSLPINSRGQQGRLGWEPAMAGRAGEMVTD